MSEATDRRGYVFVLTPIEVEIATPHEIIQNHTLQKADEKQITKIKDVLKQFTATSFAPPLYEHNVVISQGDQAGAPSYRYEALPASQWRYWIIRFQGTNSKIYELGKALSLMEQEIELGFLFISSARMSDGLVWHGQHLHTYFNDSLGDTSGPRRITGADLALARECYGKLQSLDSQYVHIRRAFHRFDMLKIMPKSSELTIIGLFSILESLLTHAPKPTDSTDSLVRQIKHKMPLVRKRFRRPINHGDVFGDINEDTLWQKMYAYRSKIVHGEDAQISGKLSVLKDTRTVVTFLREAVKLLLIESLDEPTLMTDLKEC